jgi:putative sterol carrier protein
MPYPFLSEDWISAAREIRAKYKDTEASTQVAVAVRINQVITDVPFGSGTVQAYFDTSGGSIEMELGSLDNPDATVTTDYATARSIFVDQDPAAGMQALMNGKVTVDGDMMKILALQATIVNQADAEKIALEMKDITE